MKAFLITTLASVGFADDAPREADLSKQFYSELNSFQSILDRRLSFTLAGHSSHSSHASHGSHRSSASSSRTYTKPSTNPPPSGRITRNKNSTPPTSILPSSPALNLEKLNGNSSKFVKLTVRVQMLLYAYGFYTGEITGKVNLETSTALSKYQKVNGLDVTGKIDDATIKMMNISLE
jgi:His-Xaa-Ser repeat protein HxsA